MMTDHDDDPEDTPAPRLDGGSAQRPCFVLPNQEEKSETRGKSGRERGQQSFVAEGSAAAGAGE